MNRLKKFKSLANHPWLGRSIIKKLNTTEYDFCISFIEENNGLGNEVWSEKVNRIFLDKPKLRCQLKGWLFIHEALSHC